MAMTRAMDAVITERVTYPHDDATSQVLQVLLAVRVPAGMRTPNLGLDEPLTATWDPATRTLTLRPSSDDPDESEAPLPLQHQPHQPQRPQAQPVAA
jgi:hypothetical protein